MPSAQSPQHVGVEGKAEPAPGGSLSYRLLKNISTSVSTMLAMIEVANGK